MSCATIIVHTLRDFGFVPEIQRTTDVTGRGGIKYALDNIICRLNGSSHEKAVLLVSHYDSVVAGPGASDDGVAVAAFLEVARSLKLLPQPKRDVIFLFTDGEEVGLLGARAFVEKHPWAREVGFVFNFEARGISGSSIMFETSDNNGWLIRNFAQAASHPVANSLSYEIYKRLPNSTDFTIFRRAGYSGLNFAFIDGLAYYHSRFDSPENTDRGSLQHQGDYVLEMAQHFGNTTSGDPKAVNLVYFDLLGLVLVRYGQGVANSLLLLTCILVAGVCGLRLRQKLIRVGACFLGLVAMILGVVIVAGGAEAASWMVSTAMRNSSRIMKGMIFHPHWYILAFSTFGLACGLAFYYLVAKWVNTQECVAGALWGWVALTVIVSFYIPGGSYLLVWPMLFAAGGQLAVAGTTLVPARIENIVLGVSSLPAILVIAPMVHKIFFCVRGTINSHRQHTFGPFVVSVDWSDCSGSLTTRWWLPVFVGIAALGLLIIAIALPAYSRSYS
jgi:peptidase M28-like protein